MMLPGSGPSASKPRARRKSAAAFRRRCVQAQEHRAFVFLEEVADIGGVLAVVRRHGQKLDIETIAQIAARVGDAAGNPSAGPHAESSASKSRVAWPRSRNRDPHMIEAASLSERRGLGGCGQSSEREQRHGGKASQNGHRRKPPFARVMVSRRIGRDKPPGNCIASMRIARRQNATPHDSYRA